MGDNMIRLRLCGAGLLLALSACGGDEPAEPGVADVAAKISTQRSDSLHARIIPESDLPPEGSRSLLDYWLAEQGGIPFPFSRFVEALAAEDIRGRDPLMVLIPDGRSLLKAQADFTAPRIVLAASMQTPEGALQQPDFKGRLYLGFTELANEIEVLSYNEQAGRFEFQLISDYCEGCNPRLVYAKRAICITCHQGGVPIFSVRPWEETNAQAGIAARIAEHYSDSVHGAPIATTLEMPDAIDNLTNQAAVLAATQRAWLDGCGSGAAGVTCRRELLRHALRWISNPASLDDGAPDLVAAQRVQWPAAGIPIAGNDLRSRDPFDSGLYQESFWAQLRRLIFGEPPRQSTGDKLADFDLLPRLPAEFDPLSRREPKKNILATDVDAALGVALLFTSQDRARLEQASNYSGAALERAVQALPDKLFEPAPLRRSVLMNALLQRLGAPVPAHRFADLGELSPPLLEGEPPLALAAGSPLEPFERYCFACHRGNPSARLNFMAGPDEASVLASIKAKENMQEVLDWERYRGTRKEGQLMPPADSWQREDLMQARAGQAGEPDPLEQMREILPSMFDF